MPETFRVSIRAQDKAVLAGVREFNTRQASKSRFMVLTYAQEFIRESKRTAPVISGRLRDSIGNPAREGILRISPKGLSVQVGTKVPYSIIVEEGVSKSWEISPSSKRGMKGRLKWTDASGGTHFARKVVHPPIKGKHFMLRASGVARQKVRIKYQQ